MFQTLKCPVLLKWNRVGKRFFTCRKPVPVDNLPAHLRRDHGVQNQEMLEFYLERAKDPSWADRA